MQASLDLRPVLDPLWRASRAQPEVSLRTRLDWLEALGRLINEHDAELKQAMQADFGMRGARLTEVADFFVLRAGLADARRHLPRWMRARRVPTPLYLWPARARLMPQPAGVVGIISPWNYPLQLAFGPAIGALAAGNRVLIKPSELTPRTSALMAELVARHFEPEVMRVIEGDGAVAAAFAALPFDHLVFTGSTAVGRKVAEAAARNLTPTTLELGGKSPCIVDASADLDASALKIAHGKLLNGGQTCIAPDYVFVPEGREEAFVQAFERATVRLFPTLAGNADYASIVSERHHARLLHLLADAEAQGARLRPVGGPGDPARRQMQPVLVLGARGDMAVMQEEIFGPVLPVMPYRSLDAVIDFINARPRPLALYWFGTERSARDQVLARTVSGGVTLNDTLLHIAHDGLPFGGVGDSGWGGYHGEHGFLRFSHLKPVLLQSGLSAGHLLYPPYGAGFDRLMRLIRRWL